MPLRRAALFPILLLALIAYLNATCPDASGEGDPHLTFAHGGRADFRGEHGRLFNLLSAARLSINAMTEEGIFRMNEATVNGSWLTQFHALATTSAGLLQFSMFGFKISPASLLGWSNGTCAGRPFKLTGARLGHVLRDSPLQRQSCGEVQLQANHSSVTLSTPEWNFTVAPKAVPDYYHRADHISGPKVRLDAHFALRVPEASLKVSPHGLIGQSFDGSGIAVDGAHDPKPRPGLNLTTKAMAEGAIVGRWEEYVMPSPFATAFAYSRFGLSRAPPRDVAALSGRKFSSGAAADAPKTTASASVDGSEEVDAATMATRRLGECEPPSPPSLSPSPPPSPSPSPPSASPSPPLPSVSPPPPPLPPSETWECLPETGMTLTQDASIGDTVIFVNCYVDGLQEGSTITLDGSNYEVVALAEPSGRRRLAAKLPITLDTPLTSDVFSGESVNLTNLSVPTSTCLCSHNLTMVFPTMVFDVSASLANISHEDVVASPMPFPPPSSPHSFEDVEPPARRSLQLVGQPIFEGQDVEPIFRRERAPWINPILPAPDEPCDCSDGLGTRRRVEATSETTGFSDQNECSGGDGPPGRRRRVEDVKRSSAKTTGFSDQNECSDACHMHFASLSMPAPPRARRGLLASSRSIPNADAATNATWKWPFPASAPTGAGGPHHVGGSPASGIWAIEGFLNKTEREELVRLVLQAPEERWNTCKGEHDSDYKVREKGYKMCGSSPTLLDADGRAIVQSVRTRVAEAWGTDSTDTLGPGDLLRYKPGSPAVPVHTDVWSDSGAHGPYGSLIDSTFIVYLSDSPVETVFPLAVPAPLRVPSKAGTALTWLAVDQDGRRRPTTAHTVTALDRAHSEERLVLWYPLSFASVAANARERRRHAVDLENQPSLEACQAKCDQLYPSASGGDSAS